MQMSFSIAWNCGKPQLNVCFVRDSPNPRGLFWRAGGCRAVDIQLSQLSSSGEGSQEGWEEMWVPGKSGIQSHLAHCSCSMVISHRDSSQPEPGVQEEAVLLMCRFSLELFECYFYFFIFFLFLNLQPKIQSCKY